MLIILGGLPGVGKTTLAGAIGAVHVRIDSIEQALRDAGALGGPMDDANSAESSSSIRQRRRRHPTPAKISRQTTRADASRADEPWRSQHEPKPDD